MSLDLATTILSSPINLFLNVTARCNLNCIYCSSPALHEDMESELEFADFERLALELDEIGAFQIIITGGEPWARDDLFSIIDIMRPDSRSITINTNATMIDVSTAQALKQRNICPSVSIDGPDADTHNATRPDSYQATLAGIHALVSVGLKPPLLCTITKHNKHKLKSMAEFAHELGVGVSFNEVDPMGQAEVCYDQLGLDNSTRRDLAEELLDIQNTIPNVSASLLTFAYDFLPPRQDTGATMLVCSAAKHACAITADGSVIPCNKLPDFVCGNIKDSSIRTLWQAEPMQVIRALVGKPTTDIVDCADCRHAGYCAGGCRAAAYQVTGDLLGRDPFCYAYRKA